MKNIYLIISLLFGFFVSDLSATHIVAGFSSYKHVDQDTYEIKYTLIRDQLSGGSDLDPEIFVQVYTFDGFNYIFSGNILVEVDGTFEVTHGDQAPLADQFNIRLEYAEYAFEFELTNAIEDYVFVYQRCCRSPAFANIADPSENGITLVTTITAEAQALKNSSIEFTDLPNFIALANEEKAFPINATSIDGDTLSYQFAPSYYGGGLVGTPELPGDIGSCEGVVPQGPCFPPYNQVEFSFAEGSFLSPFEAWENQGMNAEDGSLLGTPLGVGQYAYGFAIHESRNGQIINTTSFDYIITVVPFVSSTGDIPVEKIKLVGNPSAGSFIIQTQVAQNLNYQVYNLKGERMNASVEVSGSKTSIDFEGPSGMYILRAYNEKLNHNLKLIKL